MFEVTILKFLKVSGDPHPWHIQWKGESVPLLLTFGEVAKRFALRVAQCSGVPVSCQKDVTKGQLYYNIWFIESPDMFLISHIFMYLFG